MGASRFLSDVEVYTDHYLAGRLDLDAITAELPFAQINEGFAAMSTRRLSGSSSPSRVGSGLGPARRERFW
jgi:hypothetical protein